MPSRLGRTGHHAVAFLFWFKPTRLAAERRSGPCVVTLCWVPDNNLISDSVALDNRESVAHSSLKISLLKWVNDFPELRKGNALPRPLFSIEPHGVGSPQNTLNHPIIISGHALRRKGESR